MLAVLKEYNSFLCAKFLMGHKEPSLDFHHILRSCCLVPPIMSTHSFSPRADFALLSVTAMLEYYWYKLFVRGLFLSVTALFFEDF